jgi:hypothetical protein
MDESAASAIEWGAMIIEVNSSRSEETGQQLLAGCSTATSIRWFRNELDQRLPE